MSEIIGEHIKAAARELAFRRHLKELAESRERKRPQSKRKNPSKMEPYRKEDKDVL